MSILSGGNKSLFKAACALAFLLVLTLTACNEDESFSSEMSASEDDPESDYCASIAREYEPNLDCNEAYEIDGAYYTSSAYNADCGDRYYMCENNKWSRLPEGVEPPHNATVIDLFPLDAQDFVQRLFFKKCNAKNEGLVDSVVHEAANPKYDHEYTNYYKCEQGSWNQIYDRSFACEAAKVPVGDVCEISGSCYKYLGDSSWDDIACLDDILPECDTAGISEGAICTKSSCQCLSSFMGCSPICGNDTYIYMGDGAWKKLVNTDEYGYRQTYSNSPLAPWTKECTAEIQGETEKQVYGIAPDVIELYFKCAYGKWTDMSETDYYCTTKKTKIGDTCSFKLGDSTRYYMFMEDSWVKATVDSVLGYCPQARAELRYAQKDGKNYYCDYGEWLEAGLVPHQYTDSRKEGLTDEEYDVLDLPKEASVGDRVGGLLENCFYNKEMQLGGPNEWRNDMYDYCMSKNYYRYREDSTWTLETEEDLISDKLNGAPDCTLESEGAEYSFLPESLYPGENFKRIAVRRDTITTSEQTTKEVFYCDDELVEFVFGRFEKK